MSKNVVCKGMKMSGGMYGKNLSIFYMSIIVSISSAVFGNENAVTDMDENGSIVTAWQQNTLAGTEIISLTKPIGSPWESPVTLSVSSVAFKPTVVVQADGADTMSVAIWQEFDGFNIQIYGSIRASLTGAWSTSALISNGSEDVFGDHKLRLNPNGDIVAVWTSMVAGDAKLRVATASVSSGIWSSPLTLAP